MTRAIRAYFLSTAFGVPFALGLAYLCTFMRWDLAAGILGGAVLGAVSVLAAYFLLPGVE